MYIPKYIPTFAAVLLTLNYSLMKYFVQYVDRAGTVFYYYSRDPWEYSLLERLEQCKLRSVSITLVEIMQKGGHYEQQPE